MINLQHISRNTFLNDYWQQKPLVIRQALPNFTNPLSADELAGLALEEDIESRLVIHTPKKKKAWHLKHGPFLESDFNNLPQTHWTLLVQGVDRFIPEVYLLLDHFNFIPQWRVDDVMISYAALHGSVGPHYDNYDVFLYQANGRRKWSLTTKNCHKENYIKDLDLRIMEHFEIENHYILEEGDMLYLPPHVGHYGISLSEECMTYSFGYRSYQVQELLDSFTEYLAEKDMRNALYQDPNWSSLHQTSEIPKQAWQSAQKALYKLVDNELLIKSWFGCFATHLDQQAQQLIPIPLENDELESLPELIMKLQNGAHLIRNALCRFAYQTDAPLEYCFYINGSEYNIEGVSSELLNDIANNRLLSNELLIKHLANTQNQLFIYNLWKLQWLQIENT